MAGYTKFITRRSTVTRLPVFPSVLDLSYKLFLHCCAAVGKIFGDIERTHVHTDRQIDRQTDRQTDKYGDRNPSHPSVGAK